MLRACTTVQTKTATLSAIRIGTTNGRPPGSAPATVRQRRTPPAGRAHAVDALVADRGRCRHSGQAGRPQRVQVSAVGRSGMADAGGLLRGRGRTGEGGPVGRWATGPRHHPERVRRDTAHPDTGRPAPGRPDMSSPEAARRAGPGGGPLCASPSPAGRPGPARSARPDGTPRSVLEVDALDDDLVQRPVRTVGGGGGDGVDHRAGLRVGHLTEDGVPPVEVRGRADGDEELGAVGARARRWPWPAGTAGRTCSSGWNSSPNW